MIPKWIAPKTELRVNSKFVGYMGENLPKCEYFYPTENVTPFDLEHQCPSSQKNSTDTVILYLHGGGFVFTTTGHFRDSLNRVVGCTGAHVIAPNFSRPPEHKFPIARDECVGIYRWLCERFRDPSRQIFIAGDSAGGGLTVAVTAEIRDRGLPRPAGCVLISPWCDYADTCDGKSMIENAEFDYIVPDLTIEISKAYCDEKTHNLKEISPCNLKLDSFPPVCMFVGECEILRDQQEKLAKGFRDANVDLQYYLGKDMPHVYWLFAFTGMKECVGVFDKISSFVKKHSGMSSVLDVDLDVKEDDDDEEDK